MQAINQFLYYWGATMNRIFCICSGSLPDKPCGGGRGVSYRLLLSNVKYHLIQNIYFVFDDCVLDEKMNKVMSNANAGCALTVRDAYNFFQEINNNFHFSSEDIFIVHDLAYFYALKQAFSKIKNTAVVYHGQGSLYNEAVIYGLNTDEKHKEECETLTKYVLLNAGKICFPSKGSVEAFKETSGDDVNSLLDTCDIRILYNGCALEEVPENALEEDIINRINKSRGHIFISVASIEYAKGIDRLVPFFKSYEEYEKDFLWILVGNGPMSDEIFEKTGFMKEHMLWIKNYIPHEKILALYRYSDFYIMAHRLSIFDYATIEAMHMGVIPCLNPVGGNKEILFFDNGYQLDNLHDGKAFFEWTLNADIESLKEKNKRVANEHFSDKKMLEHYVELIQEIKSENNEKGRNNYFCLTENDKEQIKLSEKYLALIHNDPGNSAVCKDIIPDDSESELDLSIIVPCYNQGKYLRNCLDSILSQETDRMIEILCIDDGSTDDTGDILDEYQDKFGVTAIHQKNMGFSGARNTGLKYAVGKYLLFIDSDDIMAPDSLDNLINNAKAMDADILEGGMEFFSNKEPKFNNNDGKINSNLSGFVCGKLYKRALFRHVCFPEGYLFEDMIITFLIFPRADKKFHENKPFYGYRQNAEGISAKSGKDVRAIDTYYLMRRIFLDMQTIGISINDSLFDEFLREIALNYIRTSELDENIQKSIFYATRGFLYSEFRDRRSDNAELDALYKAICLGSFDYYKKASKIVYYKRASQIP